MTTQQELDLQARLADMERQLAELAAKVNPLYSGGMDRYIHSGYLQWDGIGMRFDDNGQQVLIPDGNSVNSQFWVARLSNNPSLPPVGPKIQIGGAWTTSSPERVTYSILAALTPTSIGNGPNSALTMQGRDDLALVQLAADFQDDGAGIYFKLVDDASNPRIVWSLDGGSNEYTLQPGGGMSLIVKETDEAVLNSTTLQDDDELLFAVAANEVWQFEGVLIVNAHPTPDIKLTFTGPTGAVGSYGLISQDTSNNTVVGAAALGNVTGIATAAQLKAIRFWGGIHNGSTAGSLKLQWAQNTADAGASIYVQAGSYIKYMKET